MFFSPLEHFEFNFYTYLIFFKLDFSLTSTTFYFILIHFFLLFLLGGLLYYKITPKKTQYILETIFLLFLTIFSQQIKMFRLLRFFPFYFTIALIIFLLNFTSLVSYNISLTGHILITLTYSSVVFLGLIIIGFLSHRLKFLNLFYPKDVPSFLLPFLILIELLSFLIRPFSLSIRLFANMLAGHTLLGIFTNLSQYVLKKFSIFLLFPLIFCFLILILEFGVALIQVYVFFILICIYLNDVSDLSSH